MHSNENIPHRLYGTWRKRTGATSRHRQSSWACPFYDLDTVIVEKEGLSVADIFAEKGEEYFRYQEKDTLEEITTDQESFILSCGGGTPCFFNNIEYMKKSGKVIWLNTSVECL